LPADQVCAVAPPFPYDESSDSTTGEKQESQVPPESADELMIRRFVGCQRDGIGGFLADPVSGRWSWSDAAYNIFGYPAGSVTPSWRLIISHIPAEDRAVAEAAYRLARTRLGPFSWSHRIHAGDATRSILMVGETSASNREHSGNPATPRNSDQSHHRRGAVDLSLAGHVIDLTLLRVQGARGAANDAVQSSARHRAVIEQAKGVLMLAFGLNADAAFALLVWHSQRSNRKLHAIAADLLAHLHEDGLSGNGLPLAIDRILTNGVTPKKRRTHASPPAPSDAPSA
jgi:PAS domain-containing protein